MPDKGKNTGGKLQKKRPSKKKKGCGCGKKKTR
ncbi:hypothetical protein J2S07_000222 [Robertmurraya andreesenii]|uniref:30S ribosomal protein THX n=1 Tax=Anoxybacillus andreesenii TaxID=1325932 RepID=A0ABT9UYZ9_9BACL|nr:hypothetical protein [Robertmurraya andreesenii]